MTQQPSHPLSLEYAQIAALDSLGYMQKAAANLDLINVLNQMYLQTIFSDGFRKVPEENKQQLKLHFQAIESILISVNTWKEFIDNTESGLHNDDILLTFTEDHKN